MKTSAAVRLGARALCFLSLATGLHAAKDSLVTAVYSQVHNGYTRQKADDGSYRHQTYIVAKGGYASGSSNDPSIDPVPFAGIMRAMAPYLAKQKYYPARDGKAADLMLVVYWGTTRPFEDGLYRNFLNRASTAVSNVQWAGSGFAQTEATGANGVDPALSAGIAAGAASELDAALVELGIGNQMRNHADEFNANLLGYARLINEHNDRRFAGGGGDYSDLIDEIEEPRYYVVIGAYDFQEALQHNKKKLLWSTRVSIRAQGNRFDERLTAMLAKASLGFGKDSGGLLRQYQHTPRVDLGELKAIGVVAEQPAENK